MNLELKVKSRLQKLQVELESLSQRKRDLNLKIEELTMLLTGKEDETDSASTVERTKQSKGKGTSETSLRKAIVDLLDEKPDEYSSAADIAEELLNRGFQTTAKKFKHSVKTTLNWLTNNKKVNAKEGKGMKLYGSIKNTEN